MWNQTYSRSAPFDARRYRYPQNTPGNEILSPTNTVKSSPNWDEVVSLMTTLDEVARAFPVVEIAVVTFKSEMALGRYTTHQQLIGLYSEMITMMRSLTIAKRFGENIAKESLYRRLEATSKAAAKAIQDFSAACTPYRAETATERYLLRTAEWRNIAQEYSKIFKEIRIEFMNIMLEVLEISPSFSIGESSNGWIQDLALSELSHTPNALENHIDELDLNALHMVHSALDGDFSTIPTESSGKILDLLYATLITNGYHGIPLSPTDRPRLRTALRQLSFRSDQLPSALFLTGVVCNDLEAVRGGSFADILTGTYNGRVVAIKRLRTFSGALADQTAKFRLALQREALIWSMLSHDHVLPFLGTSVTILKASLCLILPWMENGNVIDCLNQLKLEERFDLQQLVHKWIHQVALGLEYLHAEHTVHADLRGPNILVDENENIRLADFGLARVLAHQMNTMTTGDHTNSQWAAPELLDPEHYDQTSARPTEASDIYAFASVCIELYTGKSPYGQSNMLSIAWKIVQRDLRPLRPAFCVADAAMPEALWAVITQAWSPLPAHRQAATQLVTQTRQYPLWI